MREPDPEDPARDDREPSPGAGGPGRRGERPLEEARSALRRARGIVVLTGAGVSAESGIPTFRDASEGLWAKFRPEDLATPEAFARDPQRVWAWYDERRRGVLDRPPNPAHRAIARLLLDREDAVLVTQNVDGLHERALDEEGAATGRLDVDGARRRILRLHGSLLELKCTRCEHRRPDSAPVATGSPAALPACPDCGALLRPGVVWFGEMLPEATLAAAFEAASGAEVCVAAGTSAVVHPAAGIPTATLRSGGRLVEVNPEETPLSPSARWRLAGPAGRILPELLRSVERENGPGAEP